MGPEFLAGPVCEPNELLEGCRADKSSLAECLHSLRDRGFLRKFDDVHLFETNLLFRRRDAEEFILCLSLLLAQKNKCAI